MVPGQTKLFKPRGKVMKENKISVVIPTYNRELLLKETLRSLSNQTIPKDAYEVIVVDDGSTDNTKSIVLGFKKEINISYIYQEDCGFRVSMARNKGIMKASNEIILLLDSGIIAPRNLLEKHLLKYRNNDCDSLIGFSYAFDEFEVRNSEDILEIYNSNSIDESFLIISENNEWLDCRYNYLKENYDKFKSSKNKFMTFWTCHISIKKSAMLKAGMFDESFNKWGGEDVELGIRLENAGCKIDLIFDPLVLHLPHQKEKSEVIESSKDNIRYIKEKHHNKDLSVLDSGWRNL